jgi:hypothetical protein
MAQPTRLLCVFVAVLALARPAAPQPALADQPAPVLDNVDLMDLMVAVACTACHRAFAREAPQIKP